MGIVFRQSIKTSLVVFTGAFLGVLVFLLSNRYIDKQPLGFTRTLTSYALVLSQVFIVGLHITTAVYIHRYPEKDGRRQTLITMVMAIPLLLAIIGIVPYYFLKPWVLGHFQPVDVPYMSRYYMFLPIYTIFFIVATMLEQYLATQMKIAISSFLKEIVLRVVNVALIFLFAFGIIPFYAFVVGSILIYLIPIVVYIMIALKTPGFGLSFNFSVFSRAEYKDLLHFTWYHFLLSMSITLMAYLDGMALPWYDHRGFSTMAIYSNAVFLMSFLQLPSKAMMTPTITVLSQAIANDDHDKAKDIFVRSSINILVATAFMAVIIICNLHNVVAILPKGYEQIALIFVILFIGRFVDLATGLNDAVLSITKHYKFSLYVSIVMVAILFGLIKWLVPMYSVYGAAWATTITLICFNICKYIFVWKKLDMQPFSANTLLVLVAGGVAFAAGYFVPHFPAGKGYVYIFADVAVRSGVVLTAYLLMLYLLKPSPDLRQYIASVKKNKKLF